jgi:putative tryptophan/tyrosine transport system substrate-binding protein
MRRREFVGGAGMALVWPFEVRAQTAKIPRIGFLWFGSRGGPTPLSDGLKRALVERGYVLDGNLIIDLRYAEGKPERYPALFAELLASGADLLLAVGNAAALVAHKATATVPIVAIGDDFVGIRLAASLAHPGGNVTGIDVEAIDYRPKWLDILKAVAPNVRTVAVLADANETPGVLKLKDAAPRFGVTLTFLSSLPPDFDESLAAIASGRFDGLIVNDNPTLFSLTPRIAALVAESRTPTVYGEAAEAKMGGLIGYSFDVFDAGLRMADFVDRILKGAHPGDLPIERPIKFVTIVNLKTARALGIDIPLTLLAAADEVVE